MMSQAWSLDQLGKSIFFHQKLHEWQLLETAIKIEQVRGETLTWDKHQLGISKLAWQKVIHRGIKPIIVFAHPDVLQMLPRSLGYYRLLAMVSQKSMIQVGLSSKRYEDGEVIDEKLALLVTLHLNKIISTLVEMDDELDAREFDLWRGMAAGSQAQGSWQNNKGLQAELIIKQMLVNYLVETNQFEQNNISTYSLKDGRSIVFGSEPDIGIYRANTIVTAVEIKGGIDKAGVLERIGAALKSLSRAKEENPQAVTVLLLQNVSVTAQAISDLKVNQHVINYWLTVEDVLEKAGEQKLWSLLNL